MAEKSVVDSMDVLRELFAREDGPRAVLQFLSQQILEQEASEHLGAERHERSEARRGQRNGYKPRKLHTRVGTLELEVPQVRSCEPYQPSLWGKWQRHERALLTACAREGFALPVRCTSRGSAPGTCRKYWRRCAAERSAP